MTTTTTTNPTQVTKQTIADARATIGDVLAVGGRIRRVSGLATPTGVVPAIVAEVPDFMAALRLLVRQAQRAAREPEVLDFARHMRAVYPSDGACARALHQWMLDNVRFAREPGEVFQRGRYTARVGVGDCDCQAVLLGGLGAAAGIPTRLMPMRMRGEEPRHVVVQFGHDGAWHWAEATVPARYGEHPVVAAVRTKTRGRNDLGVR